MNIKMISGGLLLSTLLFTACTNELKAQTIYGVNGLLVHPTALPAPSSGFHLNLSYLNTQDRTGQKHYIPLNLTYGINDRAEIGITYLNRVDNGRDGASGGMNAKYLLLRDGANHPAVAISGSFLAGDFQRSSLGLLASHQFLQKTRPLFALHIGAQEVFWDDGGGQASDLTGYVGASVPLGRQFSLLGEIGSRLAFDPASGSGVGLQWIERSSGTSLTLGYVNIGRSTNSGFFFGIGYPLGGLK